MDWLNPLNRIEMVKAVKAKADEVKLADGTKFAITYITNKDLVERTMGSAYRKGEILVRFHQIKPRSFAPRGTFPMSKILSLTFNDGS